MITIGANFPRLKTNLKLAIVRLQFMKKKKSELAIKKRKEIADYLSSSKVELARVNVEHVIREDYLVEAMEKVEVYCELALARFGLIQNTKTIDPSVFEAVSSILWVAPRLQNDVPELKIVAEQLTAKYGKPFHKQCLEDSANTVNKDLKHQLSIVAPPTFIVENYLIEIAKSHNVVYVPLRKSETEVQQPPDDLLNFGDNERPSSYSEGSSCNTENLPSTSGDEPSNYLNEMPTSQSLPPPPYSSVDFGIPPVAFLQQQPPQNPYYAEQSHNATAVSPASRKCGSTIPSDEKVNLELPALPNVPHTSPAIQDPIEISFDDIMKRLENLKCIE